MSAPPPPEHPPKTSGHQPPQGEPPPRSFRLRLVAAAAGCMLALFAGSLAIFLSPKDGGDEEQRPPGENRHTGPSPSSTHRFSLEDSPEKKKLIDAREKAALESLATAETFARTHPDRREEALKRFRDVIIRHSGTEGGQRAEERYRTLSDTIRSEIEADYRKAVTKAHALADAGRHAEAVASLETYAASCKDGILTRRARLEITKLENLSREAFNEAVRNARELIARNDYDAAVEGFNALARGAIDEVVPRCEEAASRIREIKEEHRRYLGTRKFEKIHTTFIKQAAPAILRSVRARHYPEALKQFDEALKLPAYAPIKTSLEEERAAVAAAGAFWAAFVSSVRPKLHKTVSITLRDGSRIKGTLDGISSNFLRVTSPGGDSLVMLEKIHPDTIVAWTVGEALPANAAETYLKGGLFFFCDGRDSLARLYLATVCEKGASPDAHLRVFREGYLRAAAFAQE